MTIKIYCDGGACPNPGRGYSHWVRVYDDGHRSSGMQVHANVTNNQAEYLAILYAVKKFYFTRHDDDITIHTDCKHFINFWTGYNKRWTNEILHQVFEYVRFLTILYERETGHEISFQKIDHRFNPAHMKNW